jgi:tungstate transport system substrate-binding protein
VAPPQGTRGDLVVGMGTTIQDSGLLDPLVADFTARSGIRVRTTVQGTGAILDLARRGDVDAALVHEPEQERAFMAEGKGGRRHLVMYNGFILVGPPADPARARGGSIEDAFRAIAAARMTFVSRGDRSGTDVTEKGLWRRAGITPAAPWYVESGVGQFGSLQVASERRAYMLVDRGTFFGRRAALQLDVLVEPRPPIANLYHVITVRGARNEAAANAFADHLLGADGQRLIEAFGRDRFGTSLFSPAAGRDEASFR